MNKTTHNLTQGSSEWMEYRRKHYNASDASAMLGLSSYKSRDTLLKERSTGISPEIPERVQRIFDDGHRFESEVRHVAEAIIGEGLYSPVLSIEINGMKISASFDGLTLLEDVAWEHKTLNSNLEESLSAGKIPDQYKPQLEQQLLVSGAEKCLFMASNGTEETALYVWYKSDHELRQRIIDGWAQFEKDLAVFDAKEESVKPIAASIPSLPALVVQINGAVTSSNLAIYKATAMEFIENINTDLQTEQDFADAENTVKFCKNAADELKQVKKAALSQTASIEELFRTVDDLTAAMDEKRLYLTKLVKTQKESLKHEIFQSAKIALEKHWTDLVSVISRQVIPVGAMPQGDFAGAMRNKKNIDSIRSAVNDELARAKIECKKVFDLLCANATAFDQHAGKHKFLFNDIQHHMLKSSEDFAAIVIARIAEHEKAEQARRDAEREAMRLQEEANAQAAAKAEQEAILANERAEAAKAHALMMAEREAKLREEQAEAARQAEAELEKMRNEMRMKEIADAVKAPVVEAETTNIQAKSIKQDSFSPECHSAIYDWGKSKGLNSADMSELFSILAELGYRARAA